VIDDEAQVTFAALPPTASDLTLGKYTLRETRHRGASFVSPHRFSSGGETMIRITRQIASRGAALVGLAIWLATLLISFAPTSASAQHLHWVRQFGGIGGDDARGIAATAAGEFYVVGRTSDDWSNVNMSSFVRKHDRDGNLVWAEVFGAPGQSAANGVALDDAGHAYVVGTEFIRKYAPDGMVLWTIPSGADGVAVGRESGAVVVYVVGGGCVTKLDADGRLIWSRYAGMYVFGVALDGAGNLYVAGSDPTVEFHPFPGCFVAKFDSAGTQLWHRDLNVYFWPGGAVAVDASGNPYVSAGGFVGKYDVEGNLAWSDVFDGIGSTIAVDASGRVLVGGWTHEVSSAFLRTYDNGGALLRSDAVRTPPTGQGIAGLALDGAGELFVAGWTNGPMPGYLSPSQSDAFVARLSDVPAIAIEAIVTPAIPVLVNAPMLASAAFADADPAGTHSATWDWGDATLIVGTVAEAFGSGVASGTHAYASPGLYPLDLTVTDNDDGSALGEKGFQYVAVYDPAAGGITGGGTFESPAGAYTANPAATGSAIVVINANYQSGENVPRGATSFRFHSANLVFESAGYDWLIVRGSQAFLQGSGLLNGGPCKFLVAIKNTGGSPSTALRFEFWDDTGVLYDSQPGYPTPADPTTPLSGNVTIGN